MTLLAAAASRFDAFASRRFGRFDDPAHEKRALALFLLAHLTVWTLYAVLSQNNLGSGNDMLENWAWGHEFQFGYYKHPPLFAWVTALWFQLFPRADWAYFLLSASVTTVGLLGVWAAIGRLERGPRRLLAVMALALSPIWGFLAIKFNANVVQLAVWPWAIWAFLRALERPTFRAGLIVGALLGLAVLGKYVSVTLVLAMLASLAAVRERRALIASPAMAGAVVGGLAVLAPHLVWMAGNQFATVHYAASQGADDRREFFAYLLHFPAAQLLYQVPILAAVMLAVPRRAWSAWRDLLRWRDATPARRTLIVLALGPFVALMTLGILAYAQLSSPWGFPLWCLTGWFLVSAPGLDGIEVRPSRLAAAFAIYWLLLLAVVAPIVDGVTVKKHLLVGTAPEAELAAEATRVWHEASGGRRLAIIAGLDPWAGAVTFYSPDAPSEFIAFDARRAPWVTPDRIARDGALAVCVEGERKCLDRVATALGSDTISRDIAVHKHWHGRDLPERRFTLILRLPRAKA